MYAVPIIEFITSLYSLTMLIRGAVAQLNLNAYYPMHVY